ncbi:MAG: hypothetical protein MPJ78_00015 [Hyphomicrobiaceae bacterium]|nr:hypothetical protein [Hyphomicrobiaceae bacterium]
MAKMSAFEDTYTRYSFAPLVKMGLAVAAWFKANFRGTKTTTGGDRKPGAGPEALGHAA